MPLSTQQTHSSPLQEVLSHQLQQRLDQLFILLACKHWQELEGIWNGERQPSALSRQPVEVSSTVSTLYTQPYQTALVSIDEPSDLTYTCSMRLLLPTRCIAVHGISGMHAAVWLKAHTQHLGKASTSKVASYGLKSTPRNTQFKHLLRSSWI